MKREFLKELGLEDEQINSVMSEYGKSVNDIKDKADKVDGLESQITDYKQQITDRDKQLTDLSDKAKGNEDLQKQIQDLQKANDDVAKDWQDKLNKQQFDFALEKAITGEKARNPKAVKALLDTESIKLDGDNLLGLEDQLKALKESDAYLFGEEEPAGLRGRQPHVSDPSQTGTGITKEQFNQMTYDQKTELFMQDQNLFNQLSKGE